MRGLPLGLELSGKFHKTHQARWCAKPLKMLNAAYDRSMLANDRLRLIRIKIERAEKHLDDLEAAVLSLGEATFKTISFEKKSEPAKPFLKVDPLYVYPPEIPAISGDVVPAPVTQDKSAAESGMPPVRPGKVSLSINHVSEGMAHFLNLNGSSYTETLDVGRDLGSPVSSKYRTPDSFTGTIDQITIQLPQ